MTLPFPCRVLAAAVLVWTIVPVFAAGSEWHFEFSGGVPDRLVWQTEAGANYDLWFTDDLSVPFVQVGGFPQTGSGTPMEHPFTPGVRGFFKIISSPSIDPARVLFSEYVEGSSFNRALEIFNGNATAIDLAAGAWDVQIFYNGSSSPGTTIALSGVVSAGGVYVVAHGDSSGAVQAVADQVSGSLSFNGNDAIVLCRNGAAIDVIGQIGFDPGSEWGSGAASTRDNTMRRKAAVVTGDADGTDLFAPSIEWDGYANDTFSDLGSHGSL